MKDLKELAKQYKEELSKIKLLAFDIDGVLTTGHIWYAEDEGFNLLTLSTFGK